MPQQAGLDVRRGVALVGPGPRPGHEPLQVVHEIGDDLRVVALVQGDGRRGVRHETVHQPVIDARLAHRLAHRPGDLHHLRALVGPHLKSVWSHALPPPWSRAVGRQRSMRRHFLTSARKRERVDASHIAASMRLRPVKVPTLSAALAPAPVAQQQGHAGGGTLREVAHLLGTAGDDRDRLRHLEDPFAGSRAEKHQPLLAGAAAHDENPALQDRAAPGVVEEGGGAAGGGLGAHGIQGGLDGRGGHDAGHREQHQDEDELDQGETRLAAASRHLRAGLAC